MEFIPAGEVIGKAHQVRSVRIAQSSQLPDEEYSFIDMYCSDPECDCRKKAFSRYAVVWKDGKPVILGKELESKKKAQIPEN